MLKLFKNFQKQEWLLAVVSIALIVTQVWLDLTMPDYMYEITTLVQTEGSEMGEILLAGGKMLLCALGGLTASVITAVCFRRYRHLRGKDCIQFRRGAAQPAIPESTVVFYGRNRPFFNCKPDYPFNKRCYTGTDAHCNGASNAD